VCVSEQYLRNQRDLVDDLKSRKTELLRKYEAANAVANERTNRIDSLAQKNARLTEANARLRANQTSRAKWFAIGAGSTAVVVGVVGAVLAF
jgi:predicted nuclease with TOPRIM domain